MTYRHTHASQIKAWKLIRQMGDITTKEKKKKKVYGLKGNKIIVIKCRRINR